MEYKTKEFNKAMNKLSNELLKFSIEEYTLYLFSELHKKWEAGEDVNLAEIAGSFKPTQKTQKKKQRNKNLPSKPKTAYLLFSMEHREDYTTDDNGEKREFAEIGRLVGQAWRDLDENEKVSYQKLADKEKKAYEQKMLDLDPDFLKKQKNKTEISEEEKLKNAIEQAKNSSNEKEKHCYNINSKRVVKYSTKQSTSKHWNLDMYVCADTEDQVKEFITAHEELFPTDKKKKKNKK